MDVQRTLIHSLQIYNISNGTNIVQCKHRNCNVYCISNIRNDIPQFIKVDISDLTSTAILFVFPQLPAKATLLYHYFISFRLLPISFIRSWILKIPFLCTYKARYFLYTCNKRKTFNRLILTPVVRLCAVRPGIAGAILCFVCVHCKISVQIVLCPIYIWMCVSHHRLNPCGQIRWRWLKVGLFCFMMYLVLSATAVYTFTYHINYCIFILSTVRF